MVSHKLSMMLTIAVVCYAMLAVAFANPMDADMQRPIRPSTFSSNDEVIEYVNKLKEYLKANTGGRFGKRSYLYPGLLRNYLYSINPHY